RKPGGWMIMCRNDYVKCYHWFMKNGIRVRNKKIRLIQKDIDRHFYNVTYERVMCKKLPWSIAQPLKICKEYPEDDDEDVPEEVCQETINIMFHLFYYNGPYSSHPEPEQFGPCSSGTTDYFPQRKRRCLKRAARLGARETSSLGVWLSVVSFLILLILGVAY